MQTFHSGTFGDTYAAELILPAIDFIPVDAANSAAAHRRVFQKCGDLAIEGGKPHPQFSPAVNYTWCCRTVIQLPSNHARRDQLSAARRRLIAVGIEAARGEKQGRDVGRSGSAGFGPQLRSGRCKGLICHCILRLSSHLANYGGCPPQIRSAMQYRPAVGVLLWRQEAWMQTSPIKQLVLAAAGGDAAAQFNLGVLYDSRLDDNGYPVEGNRVEAMKWLLAAAEQGLPRAQTKLAEMYAVSPDGPDDHIRACAWFLVATIRLSGIHRSRAQSGYEQIAAHLTVAQRAQARKLAGQWRTGASSEIPAA